MQKLFFILASILGGLSVVLGAYGSHAASKFLSEQGASYIDKAWRYQVVHALALYAVVWALGNWPQQNSFFVWGGWFFIAGIFFFSGSLYIMAFSEAKLGMLTPFGGISFIAGWLCLVLGAWRA